MKTMASEMVGRIQSVYCKDFVSYNEITYFPKQYLNVLTGPNGTGKSTIVSAIILGLGGDPQLLDRASSIADYIKSGRDTAIIIISIYGRAKKNSLEAFKRVIKHNGVSRFYVNSKEMAKSKFLDVIASYNIQVSNLCQFLPQDRVQDFSKMNPQELLVNTMSSVCDTELIENFNQLKSMRISQLGVHADREKEKNNLEKEEKRLEQLQVTVGQYQERQQILLKLSVCNAKKLWMEVSVAETKVDTYKNELTKAKADCKTLKEKYESEKRAQEEILKTGADLREKTLEHSKLLTRANDNEKAAMSEMDDLKRKINERKVEMQEKIELSTNSVKEVEKIMPLVEAKQHELQQFQEIKPQVMKELEEKKLTIRNTREATMSHYNKRRQLETKLNDEKIPEIGALVHKIERLQNIRTQKIEEVRLRYPNLIKAMDWVAENKHKYKCNIYDPMVFELNLKNENGAMYLENVVRQRDLYAFACEDKTDMSDLINELCVKQKLSVNVMYCPPADRCSFVPTVPITEITPLGFTSYLLDLVSGPMPIINKLCGSYHIHNIPIGTDEVSNYTSRTPKSIRMYFGGTKKFCVTTSRYRTDSILTESTVQRKQQLICLDSKQLASLKERHAKAILEKDQLRNSLGEVDSEFDRLQIMLREEGDKKRKIEQKLAHYGNLENEVNKLLQKVDNINKSSSSLDTIKDDFNKKTLSSLRKIFEIENDLVNNIRTAADLVTKMELLQIKENLHKKKEDEQLNILTESEEHYRNASANVEKLNKSLGVQVREIESKTEEVKRLCNGKTPSNEDFKFTNEFSELSKYSLEALGETILEYQARLECMKNVNNEALADYHQRQAEVERLKKILEEKASEEQNVELEISNLYVKWEQKLSNLIETISTKFSNFMESIAYVGEVVLSKKDKDDFDSYGIQIMVQYRKNSKLQTLDQYVQSGGERAVAIAIYSLSLQHVTHVPFRCVDEINQGMDAKNERHIFDLLLKEATKQGSAQYLFVTPKMLRDLDYNEHLCVSVVHNSASIKPDTKFPIN